jgi:hypothetical protein
MQVWHMLVAVREHVGGEPGAEVCTRIAEWDLLFVG